MALTIALLNVSLFSVTESLFARYRRLLRRFGILQCHCVVRPVDSCVEGSYTHAPLRGPLVRPALLAGLRVSRIAYVTRYFPSRVLMTVVSLARGRPHVYEFCDVVFL